MELKSIKSSAVILGGISICFIFFGQYKRTRRESCDHWKAVAFQVNEKNSPFASAYLQKSQQDERIKKSTLEKNRNESEKGEKKNGE